MKICKLIKKIKQDYINTFSNIAKKINLYIKISVHAHHIHLFFLTEFISLQLNISYSFVLLCKQ